MLIKITIRLHFSVKFNRRFFFSSSVQLKEIDLISGAFYSSMKFCSCTSFSFLIGASNNSL